MKSKYLLFLTCTMLFFVLGCPQPRNYGYVYLENGKILIVQSAGEQYQSPPNRVETFSIYANTDYTQETIWMFSDSSCNTCKHPEYTSCNKPKLQKQFQRIVYGETPECYYEIIQPKVLEDGRKYFLYNVYTRNKHGGFENVYFIPKKSKGDDLIASIDTNSPFPKKGK